MTKTDKNKVEKLTSELQEANSKLKRFKNIFNQTSDAIIVIDPATGRFLDINNKVSENLRYSRKELLTMRVRDIQTIIPDDHAWQKISKEIRQKGSMYTLGEHRRKDGTVFPVEVNAKFVVESTDEYIVSVIRDITKGKESEKRFHSVFEESPVAEVIVNTTGHIKMVNKEAVNTFGFDRDELEGEPIEMLLPKRYRMNHPGQRAEFNATPQSRKMGKGRDLFARHKDGREFPIEVALHPLEIDGKKMVLSVIVDISERKRTEKELKKQRKQLEKANQQLKEYHKNLEKLVEERTAKLSNEIIERKEVEEELSKSEKSLKLIYNTTCDVLFQLQVEQNDSFRFLSINQAFLTGTGLTEEQIVGKTTKEVIPEPSHTLALEKYKEAIRNQRTVRWEETTEYPSGVKVGDVTVAPAFDEDGNCTHLIGSVHDITERNKTEQELKNYQSRLKALASELTVTEERERRRIAVDLHDNVSQSLALARVQLSAIQKSISEEKLKIIITEVSESMLQAAKETRHLIFDLSSPSMNEIGLAAAISEWLDEQVGERHSIETEFIDNIAADKRKTLKENDRVVLFRNVRELLTNVVKHARANRVKVSLKQEGENMKIIVEDDGIGFEQINFPRRNQDKGGFGLFSVQELMADLGGTLEILSKPGKGCKVILTIPSASENYEQGK